MPEARNRAIAGIHVSAAGLGCNNFGKFCDERASVRIVAAALDAGVTLFDTSDVYGESHSEEYLGKALRTRRDEAVISTKFGVEAWGLPGGAEATDVIRAAESSLRRLRTDRLDVYMLHWPHPETPIEETLAGLTELVRTGKVRAIGFCNADGALLRDAVDAAAEADLERITVTQSRYNLLQREADNGLLSICAELRIASTPHLPLAAGLLTGKYRRGAEPPEQFRLSSWRNDLWDTLLDQEETFDRIERLGAFAAERGRTLLELASSWLLTRPTIVSVIAGARTVEQVLANVRAVEWELTPDELAEVDRLAPPPASDGSLTS